MVEDPLVPTKRALWFRPHPPLAKRDLFDPCLTLRLAHLYLCKMFHPGQRVPRLGTSVATGALIAKGARDVRGVCGITIAVVLADDKGGTSILDDLSQLSTS